MMYNKEIPYLRVGVEYYKVVHKPLISEDVLELIIPWNRQTIMDDFGKDYLFDIPKYDGFCSIPNHVDFKPVLGNFLNRYSPLIHSPKQGQFDSTLMFLKHIFQEQLEIGLDYLALLYRKPTQPLPVLCLVSHERNTGKTTFLNFVKEIFGLNVTYNKTDDFRSPFNSGWVGKLVISVDEVLFDKREDSERIKNLSTAKSFKAEAKGKDKDEIEFFGKFILCSNFEETFIQIGVGETRYWVIKVHRFDSEEVNLGKQLANEVPAFLHFLNTRNYSVKHSSRMWFPPEVLKTEALQKVMFRSRGKVEVELIQVLSDLFEEFELTEIQACLNDFIPLLKNAGISYCKGTDIREIFQMKWKLQPIKNSSTYKKITMTSEGLIYFTPQTKGRYYTIPVGVIDELLLRKRVYD